MQVSVEVTSKVGRRLTIVVPAVTVEEAISKQINHIAQTANIKGFRPGKAPLTHVRQRFGNEARSDAVNEVIRTSLYEALAQERLQPVTTPHIVPKMLLADQPLEFVAEFEVYPEVDVVNFNTKNIEQPVTVLTDADVSRVVEQLRDQYATYESIDRVAQEKDQLIIDFHPIVEGKPELQHQQKGFALLLGKKAMIPGFEEGLIGAKAGEERTLHLTFPENFFIKERAGKEVDFFVRINSVLEAKRPELTEQFIKNLGIASGKAEDLTAEITRNLEREKDRLVKKQVRDVVLNVLLEQNPIDVPQALISQEARRIHDEIHPHHKQGEAHHHTPEENEVFEKLAKERVALGILVGAYIKKHNINVDTALVQKQAQEIAAVYENADEMVRWLMGNKEKRALIETQVLEDQVVGKLLEGVNLIDKPVSYQDLIAK
jgi:trigger factor